jgi:hypothetical protein
MAKRTTVAGTPADPIAEYTPLVIDDQAWNLRYSYNAIAEAEKATGENLLLGMATTIINGMNASQLRSLLWASLKPAHPKLTLEQTGDLIRLDTMKDVQTAIKESYLAAMPEKKRGEFRAMIQAFEGSPIETSGGLNGQPPASTLDSPTPSSIVELPASWAFSWNVTAKNSSTRN